MASRYGKKDGLKPGSAKTISKNKLKAFSIGQMNITKKLSKRAEEELKKKEQEKEAAKLLEDFVADFQATSSHKGKAFIRGSTINPETNEEKTDKQTGRLYRPTSKISEQIYARKKQEEEQALIDIRGDSRRQEKLDKKKRENEKKKSNLELFKEELKLIQADREERHRIKRGFAPSSSSSSPLQQSHPEPLLDKEPAPGTPDIRLPIGMEDYSVGSHDYGDPSTTNIFLGSINPKMNEEMLCAEFGKYGPLASVKIMWPRTDEERARNRNCGFVAYMNRKDAERALKAINNKVLMEYEMKLGWGKAVPIPPHPVYIPPAMAELTMPPPPSGLPFNAQMKDKSKYPKMPPPGMPLNQRDEEILNETLREAVVKVVIPTDRPLLHVIHRMIEFVVREGPMFEAMIMNQELNNPVFRFLFENQSPAHVYYRWKLFSILQGESTSNWKTQEFRMFRGGSIWRPPPINPFLHGMPEMLVPSDEVFDDKRDRDRDRDKDRDRDRDKERDRESRKSPEKQQRKEGLSVAQRDKLEDMLRSLQPERLKIGEVMVYCLDHAEGAEEIVDCIAEALSILQTPIPKKIARLFLISDILFNTSARVSNASYFRKYFETRLPEIYKDMNEMYQSIQQRLRAEQFKQKVMACFRAWEEWAIYPNEYLVRLQNIFLGLVTYNPDGTVQLSQSADELEGVPVLEGLQLDGTLLDGAPIDGASIDGAPIDGIPFKVQEDLDGMPMGSVDIDGIPMTGAEDLDGAPVKEEEDLDGMPISANSQKPGFKVAPSKWETVDSSLLEEQAMTTSKWEMLEKEEEDEIAEDQDDDREDDEVQNVDDEDGEISQDEALELSISKQAEMTEEKRARLREIEVKVMKFQDDLESGRRSRKSGLSMQEQLQKYRGKLLQKEKDKEEEKQKIKEKEKEREKGKSRLKEYEKAREKERERLGEESDEEDEQPKRKRRHSRSRSRSPRSSRRNRSNSGSPTSEKRSRRSSVEQSPLSALQEYSDSPASHSKRSRSKTPKRQRHRSRSPKKSARSRSRSPYDGRRSRDSRRSRSRSPSRKKSKKSKH